MRTRSQFRRIDVREAAAFLQRPDVITLDVRDAASFARAHIDGAQNVTSSGLSTVINGTPRHRPILVYCYHGNASREYAQILADFGFAHVCSLDGGYEAWKARTPTVGG